MIKHDLVGPNERFDEISNRVKCRSEKYPYITVTIGTSDEQLNQGILVPTVFSGRAALDDAGQNPLISFAAEAMFGQGMSEGEVFTIWDSYSLDWGLVAEHLFLKPYGMKKANRFKVGNVILLNAIDYEVSPIIFEPEFDMEAFIRTFVSLCNVAIGEEEDDDINYFVFLGNTELAPVDREWKQKFTEQGFTIIEGDYPNTFYAVLRVVSCG